jgi:hypothetical protein
MAINTVAPKEKISAAGLPKLGRYLDTKTYAERCVKYPVLQRFGVVTLQALSALENGELEVFEIRQIVCTHPSSLLNGTAVNTLEDNGLVKLTIKPTKYPRSGAKNVRYLKLTAKGRRAIKGVFK